MTEFSVGFVCASVGKFGQKLLLFAFHLPLLSPPQPVHYIFSGLLLKSWKTYHIFNAPLLPHPPLSLVHLLSLVSKLLKNMSSPPFLISALISTL